MLAGDARLIAKIGREELLPLGNRIRVRLRFETAERTAIRDTLTHLITTAGNANLMTPELVNVIAEHAMGNHRVAVSTAAAEQHDRDTLDEAFYLEVFGSRDANERRVARLGRRRRDATLAVRR